MELVSLQIFIDDSIQGLTDGYNTAQCSFILIRHITEVPTELLRKFVHVPPQLQLPHCNLPRLRFHVLMSW